MAPGKTEKNDKCTACGGYDFSLNDGFMYCDRCGTLFENFEEFDDEEAGIQGIVGAGKIVIKRKKGEFDAKVKRKASEAFLRGKEKYQKAKQVEELLENRTKFFTEQVPRKEHLPYDQTPDYLYGVGRRIFAFTEILSKSAYILVNELNFNPELQKMVLAVFQRYLAHCHVAFCAQEQCGDDEELRFVAIMENINYEEEERAEKRRKMLERRGKGVKMLSKSAAAWTLLTQGNITENLDAESSEEEDQDDPEEDETIEDVNDITMGFVRKVTTALSKNSLRRAGQLVMGLEMVAAILHSAILCSGYTNILISDVVRWIREDRFRIPRRALKFLLRSLTEPGEELQSAVESREHCLRFPLFEIVRTSTMLHQSLDLSQNQAIMSFEKLAARIIENLNLPVDMLSRVLLLESIIPCDMSPLLLKQVDVKMGKNLQELTGISPKMRLKDYMASFGRKEYWAVERNLTDYDEVLLSIDTKIMAYILFAIKLTFDIDNAPCSNQNLENSPTQFDIDTWIYQLEMRVKCWQGHDMSMVLRPSCPIPEISAEVPFGEHYFCYPTRRGPGVQRLRRHAGFQKTIPAEMSFHSTSNMPTVFDIRENRYPADRKRPQAILTPLNFQSLVIRKEIDAEPAKFENIDADAEATFFKDFTNFKTTEIAESFDEFFPCSSGYSQYARPDWITNCIARKEKNGSNSGPLRFFLSNDACSDILSVATPTFSARFQFLLSTLALLIGEHKKALYAAFLMLEMQLTGAENLETIREKLMNSEPIIVNGQVFHRSSHHFQVRFGILASHPITRICDLKFFDLSSRFYDHPEISNSESAEFLKSTRNLEIRDDLDPTKEQESSKFRPVALEFDTFFGILAVKFW